MSIRILHTADWHFRPGPLLEETIIAAEAAADLAKERGVNLAILAGDLFDRSLRLESSAARAAIDAVRKLAEAVPTLVIQGTPSHDVPGALDLLRKLSTPNLKVMDAAGLVVLDESGKFSSPVNNHSPSAVIAVLPETTPAALRAGGDDNPTLVLKELIASLMDSGKKIAAHNDAPLILAAHGTVRGAILPTGLPVPDEGLVLDPDDFADADYTALGHIHKFQALSRAAYAGSLTPQDFSEQGPHGVLVVQASAGADPVIDFVETPHTPVRTLDAAEVEDATPDTIQGSRIKIKLPISEGMSPVEAEKPVREMLERLGAAEVVFDHEMEVSSRVRAEGISSRLSMWDKLQAWAEANGIKLPDSTHDDLAILELAENPDEAASKALEHLQDSLG